MFIESDKKIVKNIEVNLEMNLIKKNYDLINKMLSKIYSIYIIGFD